MIDLVSLNVNGLRTMDHGLPKRRKIFTWLKTLKSDVVFLQETHSDDKLERCIANEWGGQCYFSHGDSNSRGVAVLFSPGLKVEVMQVKSSLSGRFIVLKVIINHTMMILASIYGPNCDNSATFDELFDSCEELDCDTMIIGGDWNFVFDVKLDRESSARRVANNNRCRNTVSQFMQYRGLVDIWRANNPKKRQYTYCRTNPRSKSRIDFFLISDRFLYQCKKSYADVIDGYLADHKMITLRLHLAGKEAGRSLWRFNDFLLSDEEYVNRIKACIINSIRENDAPEISRHTLLQTVLCVVRGETIKYCSSKKKTRNQKLKDIEERINQQERDGDQLTLDDMERLREERDELIGRRTESNMFHCKVNWRQNAERGTKYFHDLVRRNFKSNVYDSLVLENTVPGTVSDDLNDMLEECATHFEKRFRHVSSQEDIDDCDFFDNITQLSTEQKARCDGEINVDELSSTLRAMRNGSSPGPDGFTTGFYKMFWQELKELISLVTKEMFDNGMIPELFKTSITTLIPKKGKDRRLVKNLRPISLLNVVYKLITKTLANRLAGVIQDIIDEDQSGFLKGRYIGENVRMIIDN